MFAAASMAGPSSDTVLLAELECEAFHALEKVVASAAFVGTLEMTASTVMQKFHKEVPSHIENHTLTATHDSTWVTLPSSSSAASLPALSPDPAQQPASAEASSTSSVPAEESADIMTSDGWSMVEKDDAAMALAHYLAEVIMRHPEAQAMSPKQLQEALTLALKTLKHSKFKRMWIVGRYAYRFSTLVWSALQMYQNPWLIQAVLAALWTFGRMSLRTFV